MKSARVVFVRGLPNDRLSAVPHGGVFFLLMVLVVVAVATLAVYSFTETMIVMDDSAHLQSGVAQTQACVDSSAVMLRLLLSQSPEQRAAVGGIYNNPSMFAAQAVAPEGSVEDGDYRFTILASGMDANGLPAGIRYGLSDESARLNINTLVVLDRNADALAPLMMMMGDASSTDISSDNIAVSLLMALPGMTPEIADAILDWIDEDDEPREYGAESETYASLSDPYEAANGPISSVDELLLVRGVTPTLMFGADTNRNGVLDADEQQRYGASIEMPGVLGWASLLTAVSVEASVQPDFTPRINVNGPELEPLYDELLAALGDETYASYIMAYRIGGQSNSITSAVTSGGSAVSGNQKSSTNSSGGNGRPSDGLTSQSGGADGPDSGPAGSDKPGGTGSTPSSGSSGGSSNQKGGPWTAELVSSLDLTGGGGTDVGQILDLIGSTVTINGPNGPTDYDSPFLEDPILAQIYMPILMDHLTTTDAATMPGRININTCAPELLAGIPVLDPDTVSAILETRDPMSTDPGRNHETWLFTEGVVDLTTMRLLTPLVCGGGNVFRAQTVGYRSGGGASSRWEIILDASTVNPKIIGYRNLSHLGRGFDLSVLGSPATPL